MRDISRASAAFRWLQIRGRKLSTGARVAFLLTPALSLIIVLFIGGIVLAVMQSVGYLPMIGKTDFSLDAYRNILFDRRFRLSLGLSLYISFVSTVISTVLAIACGLLIRSVIRGKKALAFIFQLNLSVPHIVGAVAILLLLSQSGLLSRAAYSLGLTSTPSDFPVLTGDYWSLGVIAQYVWKEVPFIGIVVLAVLTGSTKDFEAVARSLGASPWQTFRRVTLPILTPAVLATSIIVFAFTFGYFEVPFILGRRFPEVLPVLAYRAFTNPDLGLRSEALALNVVLVFVVTNLIIAYRFVIHKYIR
jgi:putative spermidine/putrescine transport system permease protein